MLVVVALAPLLVIAAALLWSWSRDAIATAANRRLFEACASYIPPAEQVVFEQAGGRVRTLAAAAPYVRWAAHQRFYPTAFMHGRQDDGPTPTWSSSRQLVVVQVEPQLRYTYDGRTVADRPVLCMVVWQTWNSGPHRWNSHVMGSDVLVVLPQPDDTIRVFAGQPDPTDASRFTFDLEYNGVRQTVHGQLDTGTVALTPPDGLCEVADGWGVDFWVPRGATQAQHDATAEVARSPGNAVPLTAWPAPKWNVPLNQLLAPAQPATVPVADVVEK